MDPCCELRPIHARQRRVLGVVLWVNLLMFGAELAAGILASSTALLADSVDMLGDAMVYGFSLYVIGRAPVWQARAATLKGLVMAGFGVGILAEIGSKLARGLVPEPQVMGMIGLAALAANTAVLGLLWRHRGDDINMRSAWLCSRNDVMANGGVLLAALGVALTGTAWPDIVVGLGIAALFGATAVTVLRQAVARPPARADRPPGPL